MRNLGISIVLILVQMTILLGQSKFALGVEAGLVMPMGTTSDKYETGFGVGAFTMIPISSSSISIAIGGDYFSFAGKTTTETKVYTGPVVFGTVTTTTYYNDFHPVSIYAGPKIGNESGLYGLPALSFNFSDETRFGINLGGGYLFPLSSVKLHVAARYCILNLFGRNEGEDLKDGIGIFAGVVF